MQFRYCTAYTDTRARGSEGGLRRRISTAKEQTLIKGIYRHLIHLNFQLGGPRDPSRLLRRLLAVMGSSGTILRDSIIACVFSSPTRCRTSFSKESVRRTCGESISNQSLDEDSIVLLSDEQKSRVVLTPQPWTSYVNSSRRSSTESPERGFTHTTEHFGTCMQQLRQQPGHWMSLTLHDGVGVAEWALVPNYF